MRVTSTSTEISTTRVTSASTGFSTTAGDFSFDRNLYNASDFYSDRLLDDPSNGNFNWFLDHTGHRPVDFDDLWLTGWQCPPVLPRTAAPF